MEAADSDRIHSTNRSPSFIHFQLKASADRRFFLTSPHASPAPNYTCTRNAFKFNLHEIERVNKSPVLGLSHFNTTSRPSSNCHIHIQDRDKRQKLIETLDIIRSRIAFIHPHDSPRQIRTALPYSSSSSPTKQLTTRVHSQRFSRNNPVGFYSLVLHIYKTEKPTLALLPKKPILVFPRQIPKTLHSSTDMRSSVFVQFPFVLFYSRTFYLPAFRKRYTPTYSFISLPKNIMYYCIKFYSKTNSHSLTQFQN